MYINCKIVCTTIYTSCEIFCINAVKNLVIPVYMQVYFKIYTSCKQFCKLYNYKVVSMLIRGLYIIHIVIFTKIQVKQGTVCQPKLKFPNKRACHLTLVRPLNRNSLLQASSQIIPLATKCEFPLSYIQAESFRICIQKDMRHKVKSVAKLKGFSFPLNYEKQSSVKIIACQTGKGDKRVEVKLNDG